MKSYGQGQAGGILLPNLRKALNVSCNPIDNLLTV